MKSVYLDENGDVEFDVNGNLKLINGVEEILQRNKIALSINEGEWIFNINLGIPWVKFMQDKNRDFEDYERELKLELDKDKDIDQIDDVTSSYDREKRLLKLKFSGTLVNGVRFSEEVEVI